MPSLKALDCAIELASGRNLPEYMTTYGDGVVETYVTVPLEPGAFTIHLTCQEYVSEGLAVYVFIDGIYQCNRNKQHLVKPTKDEKRRNHRAVAEFRLRQKENKGKDGVMVAREWNFSGLNMKLGDKADASARKSGQGSTTGCIEVIVLRCKPFLPLANMGLDGAGDDRYYGRDAPSSSLAHDDRDWTPAGRNINPEAYRHTPRRHVRAPDIQNAHIRGLTGEPVPFVKYSGLPTVDPIMKSRDHRHAWASDDEKNAWKYKSATPPGATRVMSGSGFEYGTGPVPHHGAESISELFHERTPKAMKPRDNLVDSAWLNSVVSNAYKQGLREAKEKQSRAANDAGKSHRKRANNYHNAYAPTGFPVPPPYIQRNPISGVKIMNSPVQPCKEAFGARNVYLGTQGALQHESFSSNILHGMNEMNIHQEDPWSTRHTSTSGDWAKWSEAPTDSWTTDDTWATESDKTIRPKSVSGWVTESSSPTVKAAGQGNEYGWGNTSSSLSPSQSADSWGQDGSDGSSSSGGWFADSDDTWQANDNSGTIVSAVDSSDVTWGTSPFASFATPETPRTVSGRLDTRHRHGNVWFPITGPIPPPPWYTAQNKARYGFLPPPFAPSNSEDMAASKEDIPEDIWERFASTNSMLDKMLFKDTGTWQKETSSSQARSEKSAVHGQQDDLKGSVASWDMPGSWKSDIDVDKKKNNPHQKKVDDGSEGWGEDNGWNEPDEKASGATSDTPVPGTSDWSTSSWTASGKNLHGEKTDDTSDWVNAQHSDWKSTVDSTPGADTWSSGASNITQINVGNGNGWRVDNDSLKMGASASGWQSTTDHRHRADKRSSHKSKSSKNKRDNKDSDFDRRTSTENGWDCTDDTSHNEQLIDTGNPYAPWMRPPPPMVPHKIHRKHRKAQPSTDHLPSWSLPQITSEEVRASGFAVEESPFLVKDEPRTPKGVPYIHSISRPEYEDSLQNPYAVFRFKYRTREYLEKRLGVQFPDEGVRHTKRTREKSSWK